MSHRTQYKISFNISAAEKLTQEIRNVLINIIDMLSKVDINTKFIPYLDKPEINNSSVGIEISKLLLEPLYFTKDLQVFFWELNTKLSREYIFTKC